ANKTAEEATAALSAGDDQWDFVLNDPDIMAQINNYRATLDPNSKTWDAVSATITARLIQMGLDPKTQRYLID
ncbi:MAG: hypothetical protein GTO49_07975, partial [Anaerolineae bacterium]|nr:hypothetical protein [Anaerolineae bacterium]